MRPLDDQEFATETFQRTNVGLRDVKNRVTDIATKVKDRAEQVAETVSEKLDQQRESAAGALNRAAANIHNRAENIPGGPKVVQLTHRLADRMDSTSSYLRDHDVNRMRGDVVNLCRRYPAQSLLAALAIGFLFGRSRR
jgi:hypothetical protein